MPRQRAARLDESLGVLDALWSGEPVTIRGEYLTATDVRMLPRPVQRPRIPVWVGGRWPAKAPFRRAARWDGVMPTHAGYGLGETMPPGELRAVVQYTRQHRIGDGPVRRDPGGTYRRRGARPRRRAGGPVPGGRADLVDRSTGLVARQPAGRDEPGPPRTAGADLSPALIPVKGTRAACGHWPGGTPAAPPRGADWLDGVVWGCSGFGVEDFAGLFGGAGDAFADEVEEAGDVLQAGGGGGVGGRGWRRLGVRFRRAGRWIGRWRWSPGRRVRRRRRSGRGGVRCVLGGRGSGSPGRRSLWRWTPG